MGEEKVMKWSIPLIDVEKLSGEAEEREKLREACEEWGCFRIMNHPIPLSLMADIKMVARSLLDLPVDIKKRNFNDVHGRSYVEPTATNPLYEALGLYQLASSQAIHDFCSQLDASPHQREVIEAYGEAILELAKNIGEKIAESVGLEGGDYFKDWSSQFWINKYGFTPESVGKIGVQTHTDASFLTILQDDENVGGLQVMDHSGNSFVEAPPRPGTIVVILGDIAHVWSNGRFYNAKHRVECKEAATRVSIATLLVGPKEGDVETPGELVDSEHSRLFVPFTYQHYRNLRMSKKTHADEVLQLLRIH